MRPVTMRIAAAVLIAAVVSSCDSGQETQHNAADVTFAQIMIPHHQQAVDMSAMVPKNSTNRRVEVMAKEIAVDQQAEIEMMQDLLRQWGEAADHAGHGGHDAMAIDGMVDAATMTRLSTLTGPAFDVLWLRSMIRHHRGAIAMAQVEIAHGANPQALKMANIIAEWQQFEIARMTSLVSVPQ